MFNAPNVDVSDSARKLFDRLNGVNREAVYLLGCNQYSQSVAQEIEVVGFIDDYSAAAEFAGKPIVRMSAVPSSCIVVSCVVRGRPITALDRLQQAGIRNVIDYFSLVKLAPARFLPIEFSENNLQDIIENEAKYAWLAGRLADEASRQTLENITQFRLTWNLDSMRGFTVDFERQYFEDFIKFGKNEIFVDGGGYDGQTTRAFVKRCPAYKRVYYFEPTADMMAVSKNKLADLRDISFIAKGLFSRNAQLRFDESAGSASHISEHGGTEIQVVPLDDEVNEPITFMKMDLEGAECDAIEGARGHIKASHPKMAVSVYHDQRDFWRVPETVFSIDDSYKVYLRHYTEGPLETVMYFI